MQQVSVKHQLNEKLDWITLGTSFDDQVERAKYVASVDPTFPVFMRMACVTTEKITGLPEGMPETYKPETTVPDGISDTTARQELRRIQNFMPSGYIQQQTPARRENLWLQMLEGMHWKEAAILIQIKDWTLFTAYPNLYEVFKKLGIVIDCPAPKTVKSAKKESKSKQKDV
jgi:hypothetical protein